MGSNLSILTVARARDGWSQSGGLKIDRYLSHGCCQDRVAASILTGSDPDCYDSRRKARELGLTHLEPAQAEGRYWPPRSHTDRDICNILARIRSARTSSNKRATLTAPAQDAHPEMQPRCSHVLPSLACLSRTFQWFGSELLNFRLLSHSIFELLFNYLVIFI